MHERLTLSPLLIRLANEAVESPTDSQSDNVRKLRSITRELSHSSFIVKLELRC